MDESDGRSVSLSGQRPAQEPNFQGGASPLHEAQQQAQQQVHQAAQQAATQAAQQAATQAAQAAGQRVRQGLTEISVYIQTNPASVTVLSFVGGLSLAVTSFFGLLSILGPLAGPFSYLLQFYELIFGLTICAIDGPVERLPRLRQLVLTHAGFLHNNTSRALFYLFIACLEATQEGSIWHQIVGYYFLLIAIGFAVLRFWNNGSSGSAREPLSSNA